MTADTILTWAEAAPERTAVIQDGRAMSYRRLAAAIGVARASAGASLDPGGGIAAIAIRKLVDFWIVSLALRSLGVTTVGLRTVDELDDLGLDGLRSVVTIAGESWPDLDRGAAKQGLALVTIGPSASRRAGPPPGSGAPPGGHILQTSGTTGRYKHVLISAAFEADIARHRRELLGLDRDSVSNVFNFGPWTGVGYKSPLSTWAAGGCVIFGQAEPFHAGLLHPGQTHAELVPTMLAALLAAPEGSYPRHPDLRLSMTSGTVTERQIAEAKARITPHIFNRVGATETSIFAFTRLDAPEDRRWHRLVPGRGVEIVDEAGRPSAIGRTGRLRVSTAGGPSAYLGDEAATRTFFRDGFFYPGDLAVMRADGRIALEGRTTDVINLKGDKLAPAPIEDELCDALGLGGACLCSMQDERGDEELHLVLESAAPLDGATLEAALRAAIGRTTLVHVAYMKALPRNETGKVLRQIVRDRLRAARRGPAPG